MIKQTHTYAILEVPKTTYDEIHTRLKVAGYDHAFHEDVIDMHGIALRAMEPNFIEDLLSRYPSPQDLTEHEYASDLHRWAELVKATLESKVK